MLQAKYLQISLAVIIFLAGLSSGRWLFKDIDNNTTSAHLSSEATLATTPQQLLKKACEANVPIAHERTAPAPKNTNQLAQTLAPAACGQECIKQRIDGLFEHGFGNIDEGLIDYSSFLLGIKHRLEQDSALLAEFEGKLKDLIATVPGDDGQKRETALAMAFLLPEEDLTRFTWEIAQSYQAPDVNKLAFELSLDDTQAHAYIASSAMDNILSRDSAEALNLLEHVVNYGSSLSETTIASDLPHLHGTTGNQFQRNAALSLLAQINPNSQAFKDTLDASLASEPREAALALRTLARSSRHPAVYRGEGKQSPSNPATANRERIQTLANDPTTPIDVRIASLEVLKAFNSKAW